MKRTRIGGLGVVLFPTGAARDIARRWLAAIVALTVLECVAASASAQTTPPAAKAPASKTPAEKAPAAKVSDVPLDAMRPQV